MKISIFGLGYVGAVTGACLAANGHSVTLIELDPKKVEIFLDGRSPISEPGLEGLIKEGLSSENLYATTNVESGLEDSECVLISVGTPSNKISGASDLSALRSVAKDLARYLARSKTRIAIALCSTVPPQTTEGYFRNLLRESGIPDSKYYLSFIPESLREGSAIRDFREPTRYIIGVNDVNDAAEFEKLRPDLRDKTHIVPTSVAEMLKTVENSWHALKIAFANEISRISQSFEIDAREVMRLLTLDTKQNVSAAYLRPGFAFGGSCLPKDLSSLTFLAESNGVKVPVLSSIHQSNSIHVAEAAQAIRRQKPKRIAILGLAFKSNTDDLRESPILSLLQELSSDGLMVKIHDFNVRPSELIGANRVLWDSNHELESIFESNLDTAIQDVDLIVIAQYEKRYQEYLRDFGGTSQILNLAGL